LLLQRQEKAEPSSRVKAFWTQEARFPGGGVTEPGGWKHLSPEAAQTPGLQVPGHSAYFMRWLMPERSSHFYINIFKHT
jgi:hypothetical protein